MKLIQILLQFAATELNLGKNRNIFQYSLHEYSVNVDPVKQTCLSSIKYGHFLFTYKFIYHFFRKTRNLTRDSAKKNIFNVYYN